MKKWDSSHFEDESSEETSSSESSDSSETDKEDKEEEEKEEEEEEEEEMEGVLGCYRRALSPVRYLVGKCGYSSVGLAVGVVCCC